MKVFILALFLLAFSCPSLASTYGFGFASMSGTTGLGGTVMLTLKVPGTFGGVVPADPTAGRYLKSALIWGDSPAVADAITLLQIVDTDGVVPVPVRAAFPNYPIIFDLLDGVASIPLPPDPLLVESFDTNGLPSSKFIPSGLYINVTFQAGGLGLGKTFRTLIRWGVWQ